MTVANMFSAMPICKVDQCQLFQQCLDCTHLKSFRQGLWTDDGLLTGSDSLIGPTEKITRTAMQMQGRHIDLIPICEGYACILIGRG